MTLRKNISEENTKSINSNKETLSNKNKVDINVLLNRVRDSERKEKKTIYISVSLILITIVCAGILFSI
tara:strand:- start:908 stop:1114 length:207 start_codon:yes stop_codon:yes gene_type:complete